jgi:hypothetical protein
MGDVYRARDTRLDRIVALKISTRGVHATIRDRSARQPRWRRDGKELFYISRDLKLMAVDVTMGREQLGLSAELSPAKAGRYRIRLKPDTTE